MAYYNVCPVCGGNLDPGERCDCQQRKRQERVAFGKWIKAEPATGQFVLQLDDGREEYEKRGIAADSRS